MERLTKKFTDGGFYCEEVEDVGVKGVNSPTYVGKVVDKLGKYEDLEEQGLLLRLPCNVGSILYIVYNEKIYQVKVTNKVYLLQGNLHLLCVNDYFSDLISCYDIGKTSFYTREEAENMLKQINGQS